MEAENLKMDSLICAHVSLESLHVPLGYTDPNGKTTGLKAPRQKVMPLTEPHRPEERAGSAGNN